jgi:hypothetical protein
MIRELIDAAYSPSKREKILEFQGRQDYPIIETPNDVRRCRKFEPS